MKKLFLIDAYALIFRFYYAFIGRPMRNADGVNTSAVFGFVRYINEIIRRENPHYLGVAFDPPGGNFRHDTAIFFMNIYLRRDNVGKNLPSIRYHCGRSFITGRFYSQYQMFQVQDLALIQEARHNIRVLFVLIVVFPQARLLKPEFPV